jgi:hypothetical protein
VAKHKRRIAAMESSSSILQVSQDTSLAEVTRRFQQQVLIAAPSRVTTEARGISLMLPESDFCDELDN